MPAEHGVAAQVPGEDGFALGDGIRAEGARERDDPRLGTGGRPQVLAPVAAEGEQDDRDAEHRDGQLGEPVERGIARVGGEGVGDEARHQDARRQLGPLG
jgi:hypothetical protein